MSKEISAKFPKALQCLFKPARYKFIRGGRGSGKSWGVARALLLLGASQPERILCTREVQKSIKNSVHQLLKDQIQELGLGSFYRVLETEIRGLNGTLFSFAGLSDQTADSIKSFEGYTKVWIEEGQTTSANSWSILTPTIRVAGSEIWCTYNPELETDETHKRAMSKRDDTISVLMNYADNPWFPDVLEKERLQDQANLKPSEYEHKWLGRCKPAVEGAIYYDEVSAAQEAGRICRVPYDKMLKAHTIWDLGFNDSMAIIIAQRAASEIRIIDYIEDSKRALDTYVTQLNAMDLNWGNDHLPHDGFARRHQTGRTDNDVLKSLGRKVVDQPVPNLSVEQGIRAARTMFERVWFNESSDGVKRLIECLKRYRRNVSTTTGEPGAPRHDEFSHGADVFRYLALVADQLTNANAAPKPIINDALYVNNQFGWMG